MKIFLIALAIILLCPLGACSPERVVPLENISPPVIFPVLTATREAFTIAPVPSTTQVNRPTRLSSPIVEVKTPEEIEANILSATQAITITIVYDNQQGDPKLTTAWGFSALVEYANRTLLFDTGGEGQILMENMHILGIDPLKIQDVVLSHAHDDHTGGLITLLGAGAKPAVYLLPSFPSSFKHQVRQYTDVIEVSPWQSIVDGIWTTGEISGAIPEQSLVVQTNQGLVVLTGCAHPGIISILDLVHTTYKSPILLVLGGFHLSGKSEADIAAILQDFRHLEVLHAAPCHCTGDLAIQLFAREYGSDYLQVSLGSVIRFESSLLQ
jgi:7,8-dihydropterin-6-yl-methyl-4-(beta-D-ribofuranosyl)aminobenzene 5'-phosphate synthase